MSSTPPLDATEQLRAVIDLHLGECALDELRVVASLLRRLEVGRERYGELDLATDPREWERELGEELLDVLVYAAIVRLGRLPRPAATVPVVGDDADSECGATADTDDDAAAELATGSP